MVLGGRVTPVAPGVRNPLLKACGLASDQRAPEVADPLFRSPIVSNQKESAVIAFTALPPSPDATEQTGDGAQKPRLRSPMHSTGKTVRQAQYRDQLTLAQRWLGGETAV